MTYFRRSAPVRIWTTAVVAALSLSVFNQVAETSKAQDNDPRIKYVLTFDDADQHYVDVEMTIAASDPSTELMMAVWTPGSYLVREYARNINTISAADGDGNPRTIEKTSKNRWTIDSDGVDTIVVQYRVYCREMSVRTNFVDHEFAVLNGAPTFLTMPDRLDETHYVRVEIPEHWKRAVSALDPDEEQANAFLARDFDHLVDSPILVGNPSVFPFEVDGVQHFLVNLGDDSMWDGARAATDVAKVVAEHQRMWGMVPYRRYLFLNVISESGGGLEHDESTLMLTSRWSSSSSSSYQRWLGLVSHEFFHAWNIRTLRPKVLVDYDYEAENYFPSLWVAEGITSYYDDLALARAGFVDQRRHLSALSRQISSVQTTPGRLVQSLQDSSHDAWIKYYRSNENSRNTEISYYTKGAVVGFLLDMKIRAATNNQKSLDDAMRLVYERFSGDVGYTELEFRAVMSEVAGEDLTEWFEVAVDSTDELDFEPAFEFLGLEFADAGREDEEGDDEEPTGRPWSGFSGSDENGKWIVSRVQTNSPAFDAGINVDDEIIAVNEYRVSSSSFDRALDVFELGDEVDLLISRRGRLMRLKFKLEAQKTRNWSIRVVEEPSEEQKARLESWLNPGENAD